MLKACFLDKDGVVNELVRRSDGRLTSPWHLDELKVFPYVKQSIQTLKDLGFKVLMITNQPGINDGEMTMNNLWDMVVHIQEDYGVDHTMFAINKKSGQYKPQTGMIDRFVEMYNIDVTKSYLIGDRWKDIVPGKKTGLYTLYVGGEYNPPEEYSGIEFLPDAISDNLENAVKMIKGFEENGRI